MDSMIAVDISFNNAFDIFEVQSAGNTISLYPNIPSNIMLSVNYRFISFGLQVAPDIIPGNDDNDKKGKSKALSFGTSIIFKHFFADLKYNQIRGFYLRNTSDYVPGWTSAQPYIQFPNLFYYGVSASFGFPFNGNFSLRNLRSQTERQLRSAGSFIPLGYFRNYIIDDQSESAIRQKSENIEASIGAGYCYTLVLKRNLFLAFGLFANAGYLDSKITTRSANEQVISYQDNFVYRWDGQIGIGYNGPRYYSILSTRLEDVGYKQAGTTVRNHETRINYHVCFGIRFNSPKLISNSFDKVNNVLFR